MLQDLISCVQTTNHSLTKFVLNMFGVKIYAREFIQKIFENQPLFWLKGNNQGTRNQGISFNLLIIDYQFLINYSQK